MKTLRRSLLIVLVALFSICMFSAVAFNRTAMAEGSVFAMDYGAYARVKANAEDYGGLRFRVKFDATVKEGLDGSDTMGFAVMTKAFYDVIVDKTTYEYATAEGDGVWQVAVDKAKIYQGKDAVEDIDYYFANCLIKAGESYYGTEFVAIAYIFDGAEYTYASFTEGQNTKSLFNVINSAVYDGNVSEMLDTYSWYGVGDYAIPVSNNEQYEVLKENASLLSGKKLSVSEGFSAFNPEDFAGSSVEMDTPDVLNISLDTAIANPGSAYNLVRGSVVTYLGKEAVNFTGTNQATWTNNLLISAKQYKADYKWLLVDFFFNSDTVMFDVVGSVNNYATLTYGECAENGSFYVVKEVEGAYCSVAPAKNQWLTIAFRLADLRTNIDAIMDSAVDTYVSNIRAVKSTVLDEVQKYPNTISNSEITIGYNGVQMGRQDNVNMYSRSGLVHLTGTPSGTYHNEWHIAGLNNFRGAGYKYVAVDILFQTQGVSGAKPQVWYLTDPISVDIGGAPSNTALKIYDVAHKETTLGDGYWTTYVFDLSASAQDHLGFFAAGASEWYIDTITAMTEDEFTEFLTKPAKVEVDPFGFVAPNFNVSTVDGIGGKDGVTKFATSGAAWYDQVAYIYTNQYVAAGYNTFSLDIYYDGSTSFFAYYFDNINASSIAMGAESAIDGIRLLNASSEDVALASGTWITVKFDITKVSVGAIYLFRSEPSVNMYVTNAYYENIA